jgi:hypothetical protein
VAASALSPDGGTLVLTGSLYDAADNRKEVILLWDMAKQQSRLVLPCGQFGGAYLVFAPDGRSLVAIDYTGEARVWDPRDGKLRETLQVHGGGPRCVRQVAFAPDSRHFITAMGNGVVYILRIQPPPEHVNEVTRIDPRTQAMESPRTDFWKALLGKPAPEFRQIKGWLNGKPVKLVDLRGRYVVLYFWNFQSEYEIPTLMLWRQWFDERDLAIVIVCPDFGGSIEERKKGFARQARDLWDGRDLPIPVAQDGGGETAIEGTPLKTHGATHAAYRVLCGVHGLRLRATTLLIDPKGQVQDEIPFVRSDDGTRSNLERLLGKPARVPAWQTRFDQLYILAPGQTVRRVAPPYSQDRQDYVFYRLAPLRTRSALVVEFDGVLPSTGVAGGEQIRLGDVLNRVARLKSFDLDGPADMLETKIAGDWIYRKGASQEELLKALATIFQKELKLPLQLDRSSVERDVIVVRGRYQYRPLSANLADGFVHWCLDAHPSQTSFGDGGGGSLQEMLDYQGDRIGRPFFIAAPGLAKVTVQWRDHLFDHREDLRSGDEAGAAKLKALLENLSKQTALEFKIERRKVEVWRVVRRQQL